jgi:hypothetical protein
MPTLNDHDELRHDPVLALVSGKAEARRSDNVEASAGGGCSLMGKALINLYCASYARVPKRIVLDFDDAVHGGQQLRLFNGHYDEYGFQSIAVSDGDGGSVIAMLRPAKRLSGVEIQKLLLRLLQAIRATGRSRTFAFAPTAIIAAPRSSTSAGRTVSTSSSARRRRRPCAAMTKRDATFYKFGGASGRVQK